MINPVMINKVDPTKKRYYLTGHRQVLKDLFDRGLVKFQENLATNKKFLSELQLTAINILGRKV
jgi:hypothetical protein